MNDTPPEARRVAAALRRDAKLDPGDRARLLALALAAAAPVAAAPPAPSRTGPPWMALGLTAALLATGAAWVRTRNVPRRPPPRAPRPPLRPSRPS